MTLQELVQSIKEHQLSYEAEPTRSPKMDRLRQAMHWWNGFSVKTKDELTKATLVVTATDISAYYWANRE